MTCLCRVVVVLCGKRLNLLMSRCLSIVQQVMSHFGLYTMPKTPEDTISYFAAVYGKSSCEDVLRGGQGWFIDQAMISLRIEQWKRKVTWSLNKGFFHLPLGAAMALRRPS